MDQEWHKSSTRLSMRLDGTEDAQSRWPKVTGEGALICPAAVVMMDVLGMKSILRTDSLEKVHSRIIKPLLEAVNASQSSSEDGSESEVIEALLDAGFKPTLGAVAAVISDSILVTCPIDCNEPVERRAAHESIVIAGNILARTIEHAGNEGVWLRGAIAYGEVLFSTKGNLIVLGDPVREAFAWERRQNWIGGMLAPSAVAQLGGSGTVPWFVSYKVPLKNDRVKPAQQIAIDWTYGRIADRNHPTPYAPFNANLDVAEKYNNTHRFITDMDKRWQNMG